MTNYKFKQVSINATASKCMPLPHRQQPDSHKSMVMVNVNLYSTIVTKSLMRWYYPLAEKCISPRSPMNIFSATSTHMKNIFVVILLKSVYQVQRYRIT